jgi:hypothetical protein
MPDKETTFHDWRPKTTDLERAKEVNTTYKHTYIVVNSVTN